MLDGAGVTTYSSEAVAGCISDLCHLLGVDQTKVTRIDVRPGYVQAELFTDEVEPDPIRGGVRPVSTLRGWTFPLLAVRQS